MCFAQRGEIEPGHAFAARAHRQFAAVDFDAAVAVRVLAAERIERFRAAAAVQGIVPARTDDVLDVAQHIAGQNVRDLVGAQQRRGDVAGQDVLDDLVVADIVDELLIGVALGQLAQTLDSGEFSVVVAALAVGAGVEAKLGPLTACFVLLTIGVSAALARVPDRLRG